MSSPSFLAAQWFRVWRKCSTTCGSVPKGQRHSRSGKSPLLFALALILSTCACGWVAPRTPSVTSSTRSSASSASSQPCGTWSSSEGPVGSYFKQHYGEVRNCSLFGTTWVLTTLGRPNQSGVVALYACVPNDASCLDAESPHPPSKWSVYPAPARGGVTIVGLSAANCLTVNNGGAQLYFSLATHEFSKHC
jgi:hypothetical protein